MEERNKDFVHTYKAAGDVGILKDINGHDIIIQSKQLVEINLLLLNLCLLPLLLAEYSHVKPSIINEGNCKLLPRWILTALLNLDVGIRPSDLLLECQLGCLDTKLCDVRYSIIFLSYHDGALGIVRNNH